jgi:glycerol-1-phosphate dehydrogenase [NAD(P)+]
MESFRHLSPNEILNRSFECSCGRKHTIPIERIEYQRNTLSHLPQILNPFIKTEILMVADGNTYGVIGERIEQKLSEHGYTMKLCCIHRDHDVVPDERSLGEVITHLDENTGFILAVGSGVINDLCRYISARTKTPYGIIATAPSMDGYASSVSPLIVHGKKISFIVGYPRFILSEPEILCDAPEIMIQAGFGDVLGKLTALADWNLSAQINGEHRCKECMLLVERAVQAVIACADLLMQGQEDSAVKLMDALILSGLAMGLYGNSRPASGAEHHLSHYWEMDALAKGHEHALHGNMVGVASHVTALAYQKVIDILPEGFISPDAQEIQSLLSTVRMPDSPAGLGISKDLFHNSILKAMYIRDRYTILGFLDDNGRLETIADELTEYLY